MRNSKKTKTIKKISNKCVYTDETKRILKRTRRIRKLNKKALKNQNKLNTS
jgi:hypothetical protein